MYPFFFLQNNTENHEIKKSRLNVLNKETGKFLAVPLFLTQKIAPAYPHHRLKPKIRISVTGEPGQAYWNFSRLLKGELWPRLNTASQLWRFSKNKHLSFVPYHCIYFAICFYAVIIAHDFWFVKLFLKKIWNKRPKFDRLFTYTLKIILKKPLKNFGGL